MISLTQYTRHARRERLRLERVVKEQVKRTEQSVVDANIATSRFEQAAVELIKDRERLAEAGL